MADSFLVSVGNVYEFGIFLSEVAEGFPPGKFLSALLFRLACL